MPRRGALAQLWVLVASYALNRNHYGITPLPQQKAPVGTTCTAKPTVYAADVSAGLMHSRFVRWLRGQPVDADPSLNLQASVLTVL